MDGSIAQAPSSGFHQESCAIHTYAHVHTLTDTHSHTGVLTHTHTCTCLLNTLKHTCSCSHSHTYTHAHKNTCVLRGSQGPSLPEAVISVPPSPTQSCVKGPIWYHSVCPQETRSGFQMPYHPLGERTETEELGAAPTYFPATAWSRETSGPLERDCIVSCRMQDL